MKYVLVNSMGEYSRVFASRDEALAWRDRQVWPREWEVLEMKP